MFASSRPSPAVPLCATDRSCVECTPNPPTAQAVAAGGVGSWYTRAEPYPLSKGATPMPAALSEFLRGELDNLRERHLFRTLRVVYGEQRAVCNIDGKEV